MHVLHLSETPTHLATHAFYFIFCPLTQSFYLPYTWTYNYQIHGKALAFVNCNPLTYLSKNSTLVQALEIPTVDDYSFMKSYGFVTYNIFYFLLLLLLFEQITLRKLNMLGSLNASI